MNEDPSVEWSLANHLAIKIDDSGLVWHSGAARDVLALSSDEVVVATDTGGLWLAHRNGTATPAADLTKPDFWCLAHGVYADDHFYAGGRGLFETDMAVTGVPSLNWREIPLTYSSGLKLGPGTKVGGPTSIGTVYRIGVLREDRRIVLATSTGVFWSDIPNPPQGAPGCLPQLLRLLGINLFQPWVPVYGTYNWKAAVGLPDVKMGYLGLAVGPPQRGELERTVAVASWGVPTLAADFYWGAWEGGELVMRRSKVKQDLGRIWARATTMTACEHHPERMYAISSEDAGFPYALWRSFDGGRTWEPLEPKMIKTPGLDPAHHKFPNACGNFGNHYSRPNNCIAASRHKPDTVVVGWRFGGFFVSEDGGVSFRRTDESEHPHSDVHSVYFDPTDAAGERIYIASDGGVARCPGLGKNAAAFESMFNRQLATLQFQTSPPRMFYGTTSPNPRADGVVAGGLQDNGCVSTVMEPMVGPWHEFEYGDGLICTFLQTGHLLFQNNGPPSVRQSKWDFVGKKLLPDAIVPVTIADPQLATPDGLVDPVISATVAQLHFNGGNLPMYAVAGLNTSVFGFFSTHNGDLARWEFIARVPLTAGYAIRAVASYDGERIFVGTQGGRFFWIVAATRQVFELNLPPRKTPKEEPNAEVNHITSVRSDFLFASYNRRADGVGYILRLQPPQVEQLLKAPDGPFYGLEVAGGFQGNALFAATDDKVYVSRNPGLSLGNAWMLASRGLPKRPHCGDLRYIPQPSGRRFVYLSTYGRSVWRTPL